MKCFIRAVLLFCFLGLLISCGGSGGSGGGSGSIGGTSSSSSSSSGGGSSITNTPLPMTETFGNYVNFNADDTTNFFSDDYKALATVVANDSLPAFYYPTCCYFLNDTPADGINYQADRLSITSDNGDPSLLVSNARFTIGQTLSAYAQQSEIDVKRNSTDDGTITESWGELDLSQNYKISFCVAAAYGSSNTQIYVDNNTTGEANSIHGGGGTGSRIFNIPTSSLVPGERVEINIPGDTTVQSGGAAIDTKTALVGTSTSFLQFRVTDGSTAIIDDLWIGYQSDTSTEPSSATCNVYTPATAPTPPTAPTLTAGNAEIEVEWEGVFGASSYDVVYNTVDDIAGATEFTGNPVTGTSATIMGLTNGTQYFVFVRATNSQGSSAYSSSTSATPAEPVGCTVTTTVPVSSGGIQWNVWDGCTSPIEPNSIVVDGNTQSAFTEGNDPLQNGWAANDDGTTRLDTRPTGDNRTYAQLVGVVNNQSNYPKYMTWVARINTPSTGARGFEIETAFGDDSVAAANTSRVKVILRPDQGGGSADNRGRIQLERFNNESTADADHPMYDGYHIYHVSLTLSDARTATAVVYRDGVNISDDFDEELVNVTPRATSNDGDNYFQIGENSSNAFLADIDWIIWNTDAATAGMTAAELESELPSDIGELGSYGSGAVPNVPAAPTLTAGDTEVSVSWAVTGGADTYDVAYSTTDDSSTATIFSAAVAGTSTTIDGLTNGTPYYVFVRANNANGSSDYSASASATPVAPPAAPAAPTLTPANTRIEVSWTAVATADDYDVAYNTSNDLVGATEVTDIAATSTTITGLTNGTPYYVFVRAKNVSGSSDYSASATATPVPLAVPPAVPAAPSLTVGDTQLGVSWAAVIDADSYDVAYNTVDDSATAVAFSGNPVAGTSATITGLTNGTPYFVFVRSSSNTGGDSDYSDSATATPVGAGGGPSAWNIYNGDALPGTADSVSLAAGGTTEFSISGTDPFTDNANGTVTANTEAVGGTGADGDARIGGIVDNADTYPKYLTYIARIDASNASGRGLDFTASFSGGGVNKGRIKSIIGQSSSNYRFMEDYSGSDDINISVDRTTGYHIYHVAVTLTAAQVADIDVYLDGNITPVYSVSGVSLRSDETSSNRFRIGDGGSSEYQADIDWIIWSNEGAYSPNDLIGNLPAGLGELGSYAPSVWTGEALNLFTGASGSGDDASGSILVNTATEVTIAATGGRSSADDDFRIFYANQTTPITWPFTFTARVATVSVTGGGDFSVFNNSYRYGLMIMENKDAVASMAELTRFASIGYFTGGDAAAPNLQGVRSHKMDIATGNRSRSDINAIDTVAGPGALTPGMYLRIEVVEESPGRPRVRRYVSSDGIDFGSAVNSSAFSDSTGAGYPTAFYVGLWGAPGADDLTIEFDNITITQP